MLDGWADPRKGESLFVAEVLNGAGDVVCSRAFVLLGDAIGSPMCQTYALCRSWDCDAGCFKDLPGDLASHVPFACRLLDRESSLRPGRRYLDGITSDTLAKSLCQGGGSVRIAELSYSIPEDPRLSVVGSVGPWRALWEDGMTKALPGKPPKASTGLEGIPTGDPENMPR